MTRLDTVLTAMFHEDWLKYFKPLHAPAVGKSPEKHAGWGNMESEHGEDGFYRAIGFNFAAREGG